MSLVDLNDPSTIYINSIRGKSKKQLIKDRNIFIENINELNIQANSLNPTNVQDQTAHANIHNQKRGFQKNIDAINKILKKKKTNTGIGIINRPNTGISNGSKSSNKAGIVFPIPRIKRYLKKGRYNKRIGQGAAVYLTAVLDYLAGEVLELAGNAARDNKKKTINPHHITLAILNDEELNKLIGNVTIAQGGVLPIIHSVLLPKK